MATDEPAASPAASPAAPAAAAAGDQTTSASGPPPSSSPDKRARKRKLDVNPDLILSTEGRTRRRRTPSPVPDVKKEPDPHEVERAKTLGTQLVNRIMAMSEPSGESMAQPFLKLPNKRQFPDYYETIKHPLSLEQVKEKLDGDKYVQLLDVCNDLGQIWNNAKRYNMRESDLFQWAKKLHKITRTFYVHHVNGKDETESEEEAAPVPEPAPAPTPAPPPRSSRRAPDTADVEETGNATAGPSTPAADDTATPKAVGRKRGSYMKDGPTVYKLIKPCLRAIKEARADDGSDRHIADLFLLLPDRKSFPDYYRTIKDPISLDEIEQRMVARRYDTSDQFFAEVELMCDNAMRYNEDGSEVWTDANQIRGIVTLHRELVKERLAMPRGQQQFGKVIKQHHQPHTSAPTHHAAATPTHYTPVSDPHAPPPPPGVGVVLPPDRRQSYTAAAAAAAQHTPPSHTTQLPQQSPSKHSPGPYLPQLPHGVVTEEVVSSLDRYPTLEQQAWAASLPPLAQSTYRKMVAANDARKRGVAPPSLPSVPTSQEAPAPTSPTIKHIDFAYIRRPGSGGAGNGGSPDPASAGAAARTPHEAIRLENLRGVITHAVAIEHDTAELELTVWVREVSGAEAAGEEEGAGAVGKHKDADAATWTSSSPEVVLKVNGIPAAAAPTLIYAAADDDESAESAEPPSQGKGTTEAGADTEGDVDMEGGGDRTGKERPARVPSALRWTIGVRGLETKIEVAATPAGESTPETSAIFVSKQL